MENTINFEPAVGYVCLAYPESVEEKLNTKVIVSNNVKESYKKDLLQKHGSRSFKIIDINGSNIYKIGDKVFIEGEMDQMIVEKSEKSEEFDRFLLAGIGQIKGKTKY